MRPPPTQGGGPPFPKGGPIKESIDMNKLIDYLRAVGDLLMPRTCVVCGAPLGIHERHLCLPCAADVPYTRFWHQPHNPLADRFNAVLERHRGTEPMDYAYAVALLYYKGAYRSIPRALKYHSNLSIGRFYGSLLGRHLSAAPHFVDIDLILPVPLHWTRRRARGYNQAEVLARAIASSLNAGRTPVIPGSPRNLCPVATSLCDRVLSLPMHPYLTTDQIDIVCNAIRKALQ